MSNITAGIYNKNIPECDCFHAVQWMPAHDDNSYKFVNIYGL